MSHLQVTQLSKHFGGVKAVSNVTLEVQPGERYASLAQTELGRALYSISSRVNCRLQRAP